MTTDERSIERHIMLVSALVAGYVALSMMANVMSVRAVVVFGFAVDAGTLTYPLTFTLRDLIHKAGGKSVARNAILVGASLNVLMALAFWAAGSLPADPTVGSQAEFANVLGFTSRIVLASLVAQVVAEMVDTEIYARFVARFGQRAQFGRVLMSNAVSVPLDSILFVAIAFAGTELSPLMGSFIFANIVIKGATSLLSFPLIYTVGETGRPQQPAAS